MPAPRPTDISAASPMRGAASPGKRPIPPTRSSARSDVSGEHAERKRRQLYGRRKGPALSTHQTSLRETLLPKFLLRPETGRDPKTYFGSVDDVWLEVGYGAG